MEATTLARLGILPLVFFAFMAECAGVLPCYFPALNGDHVERDELVERYFRTGLGYDEILTGAIIRDGDRNEMPF